jgi:hypothetical protein
MIHDASPRFFYSAVATPVPAEPSRHRGRRGWCERDHLSIRFSLSRFTTDAEIDTVIRELPPIIARLRQMSPFGRTESQYHHDDGKGELSC